MGRSTSSGHPASLDDVPRMLLRNFNVLIVDLDSDPEYALDLVEASVHHGSAIGHGLYPSGLTRI